MTTKKLIPPSTKRVELHTNKNINEKIFKNTIVGIKKYKDSSYEVLSNRLKQLNNEWDTERVLEANAATIILVSTILGFIFSYYWFILIGFVSFFLLQHAVQGWCPPLPIIRRLGVRTPSEIHAEIVVIKYLRGDFEKINDDPIKLIKTIQKD